MIAISTAYKRALIAYEIKGKRDSCEIDANHAHSENLLYSLDKLLSKGGLTIADNDKYAVVIGAGSFTGIRIGMALVKGLVAGGNGEKVIPITTFDLMAYTFLKEKREKGFVCVINALSGLYYICAYDKQGNKVGEEQVVTKEALENFKDFDLVGLEEENLCERLVQPSGEDLLELALSRENDCISADKLAPLYLRRSQAEDDLEKKLKNIKKSC